MPGGRDSPSASLALAAEFLGFDTLAEISHVGAITGIGYRDVVTGVRKVIEQMFHVSHGSLG